MELVQELVQELVLELVQELVLELVQELVLEHILQDLCFFLEAYLAKEKTHKISKKYKVNIKTSYKYSLVNILLKILI